MQGGEPLGARVAGLMPRGHNWACLAESSLGGLGGQVRKEGVGGTLLLPLAPGLAGQPLAPNSEGKGL